jgi:hypothetical protein
MQSTTRLHDGIANTVFQEAYFVFDHTVAFHPAHGVFDPNADGRDGTIGRFLRGGECPTRGLFLGLHDRDPLARIALEPDVLIEATAEEEVFDRMALLLAAVVVLVVLGINWAVDRLLRTIMPKRGDTGTPSVRLAASITAQSSALRTGSNSGWANA